MRKSSLNMPRTPRATNSAAPLCAMAVAALLLFVPCSRASVDTTPDWLRAAAKEPVPDYPKETVAVILLDETKTTINDNGDIETLYRRAFRVLRPEAREHFGTLAAYFDSQTKISYIKSWTLIPDGRVIALTDKDAIEQSPYSEIEFSDDRRKLLQFAEENPGSVIGYEYVQKQRPFLFEDSWDFQETVPVKEARFTLQMPSGWEYSGHWINYTEQNPTVAGNLYTWELHDLPAIEHEPQMPPWPAIAGRFGIKYFPRDPALRAKTNDSWNDLALWYAGLTQSSRTSNDAIKLKVAELTAGISDPVAKMRAITQYMQQKIRYFAIEMGIGGYQPHPAASVFSHQYGDCKDKATLLSTMLQEIGIESYYVIIHAQRGIVHADYPSIDSFDHVIVAIHLPAGINDPSLVSVLDDSKFGRLLFFDPTNEHVPLGSLPDYLQSSYGLLVTSQGGELLSLPLAPPESNHLLRTAKFNLTPDGGLSGEVQEVRSGSQAANERYVLTKTQPAKRAQIFEDFLGDSLSNFSLTAASIGNLDQSNEQLILNYKFSVADYAKFAGDLLIFRPLVVGVETWGMFTDKPRKYAVEFPEVLRQDDNFDIALPAGYTVEELPPPFQIDCGYASYRSEIKFDGGTLHYKRTYTVKQLVVPEPKLDELKQFLAQVSEDENSNMVLKRASATAQ